ncbi:MAG: aminopeptidase P family protein [Anaerolineae bacterium]|nr:aminopeptidase P family protein [Anaerolineae bacterium]
MYQERLNRLQAALRERGIDCLALIPGANLYYMTGVDFHLMERAVIGFFPAQGEPVFAMPAFERSRLTAPQPFAHQAFTYVDGEDPTGPVRQAVMALPEVHHLAVEFLQMRVHEYRLVKAHLPNVYTHDAGPLMDTLRLCKTPDEADAMRRAVSISEAALDALLARVTPGMTEREIAALLNVAQIERGGGPVPFESLIQSGPNSAMPHGSTGDRALQPGDNLLLDFGTRHAGYVSDITRTVVVGSEPSPKFHEVYEAVRAANAAGRAAAGPGTPCQEVDRAARRVIEQAGYGPYFNHRLGHGIGLEAHEGPYMVEGNTTVLQPGMAFTIEPGIYLPGEFGVRIEDNVVVTENGAESLTTFSRDLRVVG